MKAGERDKVAEVTGLVLAGGSSSRLGFNKALATLGGETLVARAARLLGEICPQVMLVSRDPAVARGLPYPLVDDETPGAGPLGALAAGLRACPTPFALALACDLPFFPPELAAYLARLARREPDIEAAVPHWGNFWEPLAALYARSCLSRIQEALRRGERRLTAFFEKVKLRPVTEEEIRRFAPPEEAFFNLNYPEDFKRALATRNWETTLEGAVPPGEERARTLFSGRTTSRTSSPNKGEKRR